MKLAPRRRPTPAQPPERRAPERRPVTVRNRARMRAGVRMFLEGIGRSRLGAEFEPTVERVTEAWSEELLRGYAEDPAEILQPLKARPRHGWVVARDLPFHSQCVHHLLPFFGKVHVAFLPGRLLVGLSKLGRLVQCFARRLQIQEEMTDQVLAALDRHLRPRGAAVLVEAQHLCMSARGARTQGAKIVTVAFSGLLERDAVERQNVLRLLGARLEGPPGAAPDP